MKKDDFAYVKELLEGQLDYLQSQADHTVIQIRINGFPGDHLAEPVFSVVSRHAKNESLSTSGNAICIELADCIF
ncbi:MAG: hypothetical protein WBR24_04930 [Desulfobacterales bacterium]